MFSHDTEYALQVVVDLVNTSPGRQDRDSLVSREALAAFVEHHHISGVSSVTDADVPAVQGVRS
ncbi:MAG: CGNR zinc finger domain-containing protein, partial [Nocardioidaceae bacterium]